MPNNVTAIAAALPVDAIARFESAFAFETDCWDVHEALKQDDPGFILIDVRSHQLYSRGHMPGAINIPHGKIIGSRLAAWPDSTLFVTYCAGPHCNGAARGALCLAKLGRPVKTMPGGLTGWADEGFDLATGNR